MKKIKIPCLHETGQIKNSSEVVADYHPLTEEEVYKLILMVREDDSLISTVQCRLNQGIVGIVCPHRREGQVARQGIILDRLYVDNIRGGLSAKKLAKELHKIMTKF